MDKNCIQCGTSYGAYKKDQRYCSIACMRAARRERHRDKDNARRREKYAATHPGARQYSKKSLQSEKPTQPVDITQKMEQLGYF